MNTRRSILVILALVAVCATAALAEEKAEAADKAPTLSEMSGKDLFRTVCKTCHTADSDAGEYTPMTLIMEQWDEFFDDTYGETHKELACPKDETRKIGDVLDDAMLKKIREFCVDHAADSESPMTCG